MSKVNKKARCTCKGRKDRHTIGTDRQKHVDGCAMLKGRRA